jgi:hypothetical protein
MESVTTSESYNNSEITSDSIHIRSAFASKFNLAFYQNSVPVLLELAVVNDSDRDLRNLKLTLSSSSSFIKTKTWHIDAVSKGQKFHISERDVQLDTAMLAKLNEAESVQVSLNLTDSDESVADFERNIELLPRNQWGGIGHMPDMVAAYVLPNDPQV